MDKERELGLHSRLFIEPNIDGCHIKIKYKLKFDYKILRLELIYTNNIKTYNVNIPLNLILMSSVIEYRTIGININLTPPPDVKKDVEKIQGVSKKFMEKEFPDYYQNKSSNIALQCQNLINIYGKRGWEHYFQGQIGNLILFYFKRNVESDKNRIEYKLSPQEESLIQSLDQTQRP